MSEEPTHAPVPIHLRAEDYGFLGFEELGVIGLRSRESVGPFTSIAALGPLISVEDLHFAPESARIEQPHRGMERLFYVIDGAVEHGNDVPEMFGTIFAGDLAILTEGRQQIVHTERNMLDRPARAYVLSYPTDPIPATASFVVLQGDRMPRLRARTGVESTVLLERGGPWVHGQVHEMADTRLEGGGAFEIALEPGEGAVMFCLAGRMRLAAGAGVPPTVLDSDDTLLFPPAPESRRVEVEAEVPARILHVVTGTGFGLRLQDVGPGPEA